MIHCRDIPAALEALEAKAREKHKRTMIKMGADALEELIGDMFDAAFKVGCALAITSTIGVGGCSYMAYRYHQDIKQPGYTQLYEKAKGFADQNKDGTLSFDETADLYKRAGREYIFAPDQDTSIKKLTESELERAIASYR